MKKIIFIFILSLFIMGSGPLAPELGIYGKGQSSSESSKEEKPEQIKPLSNIMVYCNTKKFIENMAKNDYNLQLAAKGLVQDERHKHLSTMQLWINADSLQWAVVYGFRNKNKACILGGNRISLYSPGRE